MQPSTEIDIINCSAIDTVCNTLIRFHLTYQKRALRDCIVINQCYCLIH